MIRSLGILALAVACVACAPEQMAQPPFVPHAASGTVTWQPLVQRETKAIREGAVVAVDV